MGCSFSCKRLSSSITPNTKSIRIVRSNGYIEEIEHPVTVAQVAGNPPSHFLFTHSQLLASALTAPLKSDALLESGHEYVLLSLLDCNMSPADLAPITRKLASISRHSKSISRKQSLPHAKISDRSFPDRKYSKTDIDQVKRSWKPVLDTIHERSSDRRSETE